MGPCLARGAGRVDSSWTEPQGSAYRGSACLDLIRLISGLHVRRGISRSFCGRPSNFEDASDRHLFAARALTTDGSSSPSVHPSRSCAGIQRLCELVELRPGRPSAAAVEAELRVDRLELTGRAETSACSWTEQGLSPCALSMSPRAESELTTAPPRPLPTRRGLSTPLGLSRRQRTLTMCSESTRRLPSATLRRRTTRSVHLELPALERARSGAHLLSCFVTARQEVPSGYQQGARSEGEVHRHPGRVRREPLPSSA